MGTLKLGGKWVFITGGSSGIGYAFSREFLGLGANVLLIARDGDKLKSAAESLRKDTALPEQRIEYLPLDIADFKMTVSVLEQTVEKIGTPYILINGAGIPCAEYFSSISLEDFRKVVDINLSGAIHVTKTLSAMMLENGGHIVNISSMAGLVGVFGYTAYSASKFGLVGFSECLRSELKPRGIQVHLLCPPDTDTPQLVQEAATIPAETKKINGNVKVLQPSEVARYTISKMIKNKFMIIPGFNGKFVYFMVRLAPGFVRWMIDRDVKSFL
jgi:3-dehydrosphinganine reductase